MGAYHEAVLIFGEMIMWITRDEQGYSYCVEIWAESKPKKNIDGIFYSSGVKTAGMDITNFKRIFGYTPRKGSIRKVKITAEDAE